MSDLKEQRGAELATWEECCGKGRADVQIRNGRAGNKKGSAGALPRCLEILLQLVPADDLVLGAFAHIHEDGAVAGDAHHEILIIFRMLLGLP